MQGIKKFILTIVVIATIFVPLEVSAKSNNVNIIDEANLLSNQEEAQLQEYLESLNSEINYVVATTDTSDYGDVDSKLYHYYILEYPESADGVAFIIDMYNREVYISGYGSIAKEIRNSDALDITDNIYRYATKGDYYNCIYKAFVQANTLVNDGYILRPMRIIVSLLVAIILGFFGTFIWAIVERSNVDMSSSTSQILMTGATIAGTAAIYDTKRVRRSSDSGGGHSGGGFSGGGGGGFSGGGGHSGGGHSF